MTMTGRVGTEDSHYRMPAGSSQIADASPPRYGDAMEIRTTGCLSRLKWSYRYMLTSSAGEAVCRGAWPLCCVRAYQQGYVDKREVRLLVINCDDTA